MREFILAHFAVSDGNAGLGNPLVDAGGTAVNGFDVVMDVIALPATPQFPFESFSDDTDVVFQHIGLNGMAVLGRFLDNRHIADTGHSHV